MYISEVVQKMHPYERLKISGKNKFDENMERIWTQSLTDAQKYAYWQKEVLSHTVDLDTNTIYCVVRE